MDFKAISHRLALPALGRLPASLRGRPDSEHEMSFNRLAMCLIIFVYLAVLLASGDDHFGAQLILMFLYPTVAVAIFLHILWRPQISYTRRYFALAADMATLSAQLHVGGEISSIFF